MTLSPYFPYIYIYLILYFIYFPPFSLWILNDISFICNLWPCPSSFFKKIKKLNSFFFLSVSNDHKCVMWIGSSHQVKLVWSLHPYTSLHSSSSWWMCHVNFSLFFGYQITMILYVFFFFVEYPEIK